MVANTVECFFLKRSAHKREGGHALRDRRSVGIVRDPARPRAERHPGGWRLAYVEIEMLKRLNRRLLVGHLREALKEGGFSPAVSPPPDLADRTGLGCRSSRQEDGQRRAPSTIGANDDRARPFLDFAFAW